MRSGSCDLALPDFRRTKHSDMKRTEPHITGTSRMLAMAGLANGITGILLQYVLFQPLFRQIGMGWGTSAIAMLMYFTILTNLMVIAAWWAHLKPQANRLTRFFARPGVRTAVTAYIVFVAVIYALFISGQLPLSAAQKVPDAMLHYIAPVLCLLWWWASRPNPALHYRTITRWMIWPVSYLAVSVLIGAVTGAWLYPILDAGKLGWTAVMLNAAGMVAFLAGLMALLIAATRRLSGNG
jgi:hypothetical protein